MNYRPEFIAIIASELSQMHGINFQYASSEKSTQIAITERFNGSYRRRVLNIFLKT